MSNITILSTEIRHRDNLYSLNDLHRASGGAQKHQPNRFLRNEQTKALIAEIGNYPNLGNSIGGITPFKVLRGSQGGTYACRELVIAYAAWISAAFHLKVIRVFLDAQGQEVKPHPLAPIPYHPFIPADKPNLANSRWRLTIGENGQASMGLIPEGALMITKEMLLEYINRETELFPTDYITKLAVACTHRLDKDAHQWQGERSRARDTHSK